MKTKIVGYGRMSTDKQALSLGVQKKKCEEWFRTEDSRCRWENGAEWMGMVEDDAGSSRVNMLMRPNGQRLTTMLDPGDMIVVASLSRAFRSAGDMEHTLDTMTQLGVEMVFLDVQVDTTTPTGKMFLGILAVMSRFERELISQRTRDAIESKIRRGEPTSLALPGYRSNGKTMLVDKDKRTVAFAAMNLFRAGMTRLAVERQIRHFARKTKIKCVTTGRSLVTQASACCLGFPRCSVARTSSILGINTDTIEFIKRDDHDQLQKQLEKGLLEDGFEPDVVKCSSDLRPKECSNESTEQEKIAEDACSPSDQQSIGW